MGKSLILVVSNCLLRIVDDGGASEETNIDLIAIWFQTRARAIFTGEGKIPHTERNVSFFSSVFKVIHVH